MDNIVIKKAEQSDFDDMVNIRNVVRQRAYKNIYPEGFFTEEYFKKQTEKLKGNLLQDNYEAFVLLVNNKTVAYSVLEYGGESFNIGGHIIDGRLSELYVSCDFVNLSLGSELFKHAKQTFKSKGYKNFFVWCLKDNIRSMNFYTNKQKGKVVYDEMWEDEGCEVMTVAVMFDL